MQHSSLTGLDTQTPNSSSHSSMIISSCSRTQSTSVNARYPTPPRCIPILNRAQPPSIYLDYGIEMYRICSVSEGPRGMYVNSQSCVVAPQGLADQVRLDILLSFVGAELELKSLPQAVCGLLNPILKARHLRFAAHYVDQVDQTISRSA
jgi:hypothetical protein